MTNKFEHKPGRGSAFANNKKDATNKQPDFKGDGKDINGNDIWISIWKNKSGDIEKRDIAFEPKLKNEG